MFRALVYTLHDSLKSYALLVQKNGTLQDPSALTHSKEWRMFLTKLINPENKSRWMNVPHFIAILEHSIAAVLQIHHHELRTMPETTKDVGGVEACTELILGLDNMLESSVGVLPSGRHYLLTIQA